MSSDFELIDNYPYANDDLWDSINSDYLKGVEQAIKDGADVNFEKNNYTPLQKVIQDGKIDFIKLLLKNKANPDLGNPLLIAVQKEDIQLATLLLEHGANPHIRQDNKRSILMEAISRGEIDIIKLLLENGAKPYGWDKGWYTPLHLAISEHKKEIVELLLVYGADPNVKGVNNWTAWEYANYTGNRKYFIQILEKHIKNQKQTGEQQ